MSNIVKTYEKVEDIKNMENQKLQDLLNRVDIEIFNIVPVNNHEIHVNMQKAMSSMSHKKMMKHARIQDSIHTCPEIKEELKFIKKNISSFGSIDNKEPNKLPAVKSTEILTNSLLSVKWVSVDDLPGSSIESIRALGSLMFKSYNKMGKNNIPERFLTEDIITISTLLGNTELEMNSMLHWITTLGTPKVGFSKKPMEVDLTKIIPDYKPQILYYELGNLDFKIVKDFMGLYIYSWANSS